MALSSGARLGPYEIVASLGAGGMGEVYRARDTRLSRDVAIKILPPSISKDPIARQRFEREAKTISGLNHPNICIDGRSHVGHNGNCVAANRCCRGVGLQLVSARGSFFDPVPPRGSQGRIPRACSLRETGWIKCVRASSRHFSFLSN